MQQLKDFVAFVAAFDIATPQQKENAKKINAFIEAIDKPDLKTTWSVCLDIFDVDLQNGINRDNEFENEGVYWRSWSVYFEADMLLIVAKSEHTDFYVDGYTGHFIYNGGYYVHKIEDAQNVYLDKPLALFLEDANNYKKYTTDTLNTIEIQIDFTVN